MDLPKALKRFRQEYHLTQKQVSSAVGINIRLYQKYEAGEVDPGASVIAKLCETFNVSANYLFGLGEEPDEDDIIEDEFDEAECKLLSVYSALNKTNRQTLMDMTEFLFNKQGLKAVPAVAIPRAYRRIRSLRT